MPVSTKTLSKHYGVHLYYVQNDSKIVVGGFNKLRYPLRKPEGSANNNPKVVHSRCDRIPMFLAHQGVVEMLPNLVK